MRCTTHGGPVGPASRSPPPGGKKATPPPAPERPAPGATVKSWDELHTLWHHRPSHFFSPPPPPDAADAAAAGVAKRKGEVRGAGATKAMMEGVVLRVDDPRRGVLLRRCKCVHDEFVQDIEEAGHWRSQKLVKNLVAAPSAGDEAADGDAE